MKELIDQIILFNEGKEYTTLLLDYQSYLKLCQELSPQNSAEAVFRVEVYKNYLVRLASSSGFEISLIK